MNFMKNLVLGILAHVDAGKTTMAEAMLFSSGKIRNLGRVDHKDAFLDNNSLERERGITIFSKQAVFPLGDDTVYLQDTPGHVDFSSEMERTLCVLDFAVLVISAPDGIQAHTELLMELLEKHSIPTFVFINKTDLEYTDRRYPDNWIDFNNIDFESIALCSEEAMAEFLDSGSVSDNTISKLIESRAIIPCYKGSALKLDGIDELLSGLAKYAPKQSRRSDFGAKCFKITRDENGGKLSWLKITGGSLSVREVVNDEKITRIRVYSGSKSQDVKTIEAGSICAVSGLEKSYSGMGLGFEEDQTESALEPVLTYRIRILDGTDNNLALKKLAVLSEEDPLLRINWNSELSEIQISLMGQVQTEVLTQVISDRFGLKISIEEGRVVYKETIKNPVEGVGHFEPLRHYAEVHLLMEPLAPGSGLILETACSEDILDRNWQRLILFNLAEYTHRGVLTGAPLTDIKITLVAGRSHLKHTEGGDFRQASLRAVRQGLMKAENVLLEPFYRFKAEIPVEHIGLAISDFKAMGGIFDAPENLGDITVISGVAPVSELSTYQTTLLSYTKGRGKLSCRFGGYYPCHNTEKVIEQTGYDPSRDINNPSSSIFCSHGSGTEVKWNHVEEFEHMESGLSFDDGIVLENSPKLRPGNFDFDERELEEIMQREFGAIKRPKYSTVVYEPSERKTFKTQTKKEYLVVDGYNMIFAWDALKKLAEDQIAAAREVLIDTLAGYHSTKGTEIILVFDGYKVRGNEGTKESRGGINIVYTKEGKSADAYIEELVHDLGHTYNVVVASSDGLIQLTALREGTKRMSASELESLVDLEKKRIEEIISSNNYLTNKLGDTAIISRD